MDAALKVRIGADISAAKAAFREMRDATKKLSDDLRNVGRSLSTYVTLPLAGVGVAAVKLSSDFEKSMNRVRALSGAAGEDFEKLRGQARQLGADTQFSASEAADAMSFLAQAGFKVEQIYASMPDTLNLAAAAQLDMGSSADIVSNIMTGLGLQTEELGAAVDVLTKAFISSNTDLRMLGEGMKYVGPVASGFGVSIEQTTAALGALSNAGIQGSMAGTTLRGILNGLTREADKLGVTTLDSAGNLRPLADIIDDINARGLSTARVMEIFGDRAGPGMVALLSQGGEALRQFTRELEDAGGTAEGVAKTQMEGLHGMVKELQSAVEELALSLGDAGLLGFMKGLTTGLTNLVRRFNELPQSAKTAALVIGSIAAAIGPALLALGSFVKLLPVFAAGFAVLTGPIGLAVAALAGVGAALVFAYQRSETFREAVGRLAGAMRRAGAALLGAARTALDRLKALWEAVGEDVIRIVTDAFETLLGVASALLDRIATVLQVWTAVVQGDWKKAWQTMRDDAIDALGDIEDYMRGTTRTALSVAGAVVGVAGAFLDLIPGLDGAAGALGKTRDLLLDVRDGYRDAAAAAGDLAKIPLIPGDAMPDPGATDGTGTGNGNGNPTGDGPLSDILKDLSARLAALGGMVRDRVVTAFSAAEERAQALRSAVREAYEATGGRLTAGVAALVERLREAEAEVRTLTRERELRIRLNFGDVGARLQAGLLTPMRALEERAQRIRREVARVFALNGGQLTPALQALLMQARELEQQAYAMGKAMKDALKPSADDLAGGEGGLVEIPALINDVREGLNELGIVLSATFQQAAAQGVLAFTDALGHAAGQLLTLQSGFGDFASAVVRSLRQVIAQVIAMIMRLLALRAILAAFGISSGGGGFIGAALRESAGLRGVSGSLAAAPAAAAPRFAGGEFQVTMSGDATASMLVAWNQRQVSRGRPGLLDILGGG